MSPISSELEKSQEKASFLVHVQFRQHATWQGNAMNFWATIEHSLQYKYKTNIPPHVRERLSKAAEAIIALDNEMSSVRGEIMNAQNSSLLQRNLVMDILGNIENLYRKSSKREVEKIQDEFYRIYASNDLMKLKRFHQQLDVIAEGYRAQAVTCDPEM